MTSTRVSSHRGQRSSTKRAFDRLSPALTVRIRHVDELGPSCKQIRGPCAIAVSVVTLAEPPVLQDRCVRTGERDLGGLGSAMQIRGEHDRDAIVSSSLTNLRSRHTAVGRQATVQPSGRDTGFVVLAPRMRLVHERYRHDAHRIAGARCALSRRSVTPVAAPMDDGGMPCNARRTGPVLFIG